MTIQEMSIENLKDALINGQRYILRAPQVQQEIMLIEQELAKRQSQETPPLAEESTKLV